MLGLPVPVATNACAPGIGLPATLTSQPNDPPQNYNNDVMYLWDTSTGYHTYYFFNAADAATWGATSAGPDFFDKDTGNSVGPIPVSNGFMLLHHGATVNWTNVFKVQ